VLLANSFVDVNVILEWAIILIAFFPTFCLFVFWVLHIDSWILEVVLFLIFVVFFGMVFYRFAALFELLRECHTLVERKLLLMGQLRNEIDELGENQTTVSAMVVHDTNFIFTSIESILNFFTA
jgi:hypothetical protein